MCVSQESRFLSLSSPSVVGINASFGTLASLFFFSGTYSQTRNWTQWFLVIASIKFEALYFENSVLYTLANHKNILFFIQTSPNPSDLQNHLASGEIFTYCFRSLSIILTLLFSIIVFPWRVHLIHILNSK